MGKEGWDVGMGKESNGNVCGGRKNHKCKANVCRKGNRKVCGGNGEPNVVGGRVGKGMWESQIKMEM